MTSREVIIRAIEFKNPGRLPRSFPAPFLSDFAWAVMSPHPDNRPKDGVDEWGCVWQNFGFTNLGEVKDSPIKEWEDFAKMQIPQIDKPDRFSHAHDAREKAGDKFLLSSGISLYERAHFLRGIQNLWMDIYLHPQELEKLLDVLLDLNLEAIKGYAKLGVDGYFIADDWGLQDRLMISPEHWRTFWKPRYQKMFAAVKKAGMYSFMHSCGHIMDILDDLIEIGLDVVQMDQQENMGLENLGQRFKGRITFMAPVDIQQAMYKGPDAIRAYARKMVENFATKDGGFIPSWYGDPRGVKHPPESVEAMCTEFMKLSDELYASEK